MKPEQIIDVICQHKCDGTIMPIKLRFQDEDKLYQEYVVKSYKVTHRPGQYMLPSEIPTISNRWDFECIIIVFNVEKRIKLSYNTHEGLWKMSL